MKTKEFWLYKGTIVVLTLILASNFNIQLAYSSSIWDDTIQLVLANDFMAPSSLTSSLFLVTGGDALIGQNASQSQIINVTVTAYSSTPDQTKPDDPFTTASGTRVHDGTIAANFLDFGTKVKIPAVFGDKVFVVEDRMAKRFGDRIDIWFPERNQAEDFGIQKLEIIVL